jgi:hypothetical protein
MASDVLNWEVPMVFLKQFYDAADGNYACYQAIVEASTRVTALFEATPLPDAYRFTFTPCASHPIQDDLGLADQSQAIAAFRAEIGCTFERGRVVWETLGRAPLGQFEPDLLDADQVEERLVTEDSLIRDAEPATN